MLYWITPATRSLFEADLDEMFRVRKRIFIDELKWDLTPTGEWEKDQFDDDATMYLVARDEEGAFVGGSRLSLTTRPHMMSDVFAHLCDRPWPTGPDVWETSRYFIAPEMRKSPKRSLAHAEMICGQMEAALLHGVTRLIGVVETAILPKLLNPGWEVEPLGLPKDVGGVSAVASVIHVSAHGLSNVRRIMHLPSGGSFLNEMPRAA